MIILAQVYGFRTNLAQIAEQKTTWQIPLWKKRRGFVNNATIFKKVIELFSKSMGNY